MTVNNLHFVGKRLVAIGGVGSGEIHPGDLVEVVFAGLSRCVNVVSVKVFPGGPLGLSFDSLLQINIGPGAEISACEMLSCSR